MAETKKKGLGLPQTKGAFQVRGKVTGTQKEKFYTEKTTKNGDPWRGINFGVEFAPGSTVFLNMTGMPKDEVFFSKRNEETKKVETERVKWSDRFTFNKEGYQLIGVNRIKDSKGNDINEKKRMVEYDACKEISEHLKDNNTVFTKGTIEYSQYNGKHSTKFIPNQVSLGKDVDFEAEDFTPNAKFTQTIVFMSIAPNDDKSKYLVQAKIVNYNTIEDAEFVIKDASLANVFRKNLKPYTSINTWGSIEVEEDVTEVTETDCWGTSNAMDRVNNPTIRELVIEGADPSTIDTTTYTEEEMDKAIESLKASKDAENDFGGTSSGWGSVKSVNDDDETGW